MTGVVSELNPGVELLSGSPLVIGISTVGMLVKVSIV